MTDYALLQEQARCLLAGESHPLPSMANLAALLWQSLEGLNWAGFYVREGDGLVLGPFQGKPACIRIPLGRGVCGTAAALDAPQRVEDVRRFPRPHRLRRRLPLGAGDPPPRGGTGSGRAGPGQPPARPLRAGGCGGSCSGGPGAGERLGLGALESLIPARSAKKPSGPGRSLCRARMFCAAALRGGKSFTSPRLSKPGPGRRRGSRSCHTRR